MSINIRQRLLIFVLIFLGIEQLPAQNDSIEHQKIEIALSGFSEVYYVFDFNQPVNPYRQSFLYNHNRHNEVNINLGYLKASLNHEKYRANLAFHSGTYVLDNYATEPALLRNIHEATIGLSINRKNTVWLDVGILPSHIGFESAVSVENFTLTRSLLAENSPYYCSGAKISFNPTPKTQISGLFLNGWQRIQRLPGNSLPSFGTQLKTSLSERITLNWNTFTGTDDPDSTRRMRYYNNVYGIMRLSKKISVVAGFDLGIQQQAKKSSLYNIWYSPVIIGSYTFNDKWKLALRAEYYQDSEGVIITTNALHGFSSYGNSINIDYSPSTAVMCRLECRWLNNDEPIFEKRNSFVKDNFFIATSLSIKFSEILTK